MRLEKQTQIKEVKLTDDMPRDNRGTDSRFFARYRKIGAHLAAQQLEAGKNVRLNEKGKFDISDAK
jgi:hypothetical protein